MKIRHKVGELIRQHGLSYSQFGRRAGIGMRTAKELYDNPYYLLETPTLIKCAQFFAKEPGELVVDEELEASNQNAIAPEVKTPSDPEFLNRLLQFFVSDSILEQVKRVAPMGLVAFINEAIAWRLEINAAKQVQLPEPIQQAIATAAGDKVDEWIAIAIVEKLERDGVACTKAERRQNILQPAMVG